MARAACIDIGSNTTRLLVAEPDGPSGLRAVAVERAFTPADPEVLAAIVAAQLEAAAAARADRTRVVATAHVRDHPRREEVVAALPCAVDLLSGTEEAELAFLGATYGLAGDERVGVVDVGGGSTELVTGTPGAGPDWSASFRVGSRVLAEAYLRSDPPPAAELAKVRRHAEGVFEGLDCPRPARAFAVGGSATSMRQLCGAEVVDRAVLQGAIGKLTAAPAAAVAAEHGIEPRRVRILPAGLLVLEAAAATLGCPLRIGSGGLREGVVLRELAAMPPMG